MRTIQTPTIPTLVTGLSIRSQADLQEQLRIKQTTEREQQKLYAPPAPASFKRRLEDEELVQRELAEVKEAEEPPSPDFPRMPIMRKEELFSAPPRLTPQSSLGSVAEEEDFTGYFSRPKEAEQRPLRPPARPARRGRPPSGFKTVKELKDEIKGMVSPPPKGLSGFNQAKTRQFAESIGIDIMK